MNHPAKIRVATWVAAILTDPRPDRLPHDGRTPECCILLIVSSPQGRSMAVGSSHAVYVGSFDPLTLGHLDIIRRGARIFAELTVGIGINPDKEALFSSEERVAMCESAVSDLNNVQVTTFEGLSVEFVRKCNSRILLRGVRSLMDIDSEFTMSLANRVLDDEIESVFLMSGERYNHVSSSLIKQIARMGTEGLEEKLADFVPQAVIRPLLKRFAEANA